MPVGDPPYGNSDFLNWLYYEVGVEGGRAGTVTSSIITGLTSFSWSFGVRPLATPVLGHLWQCGGTGLDFAHARLSINASSQVVFDNPDEGGPVLTSTTALAAGVWTHICATYDDPSGNVQLIINGSLEDSDTGAVWTQDASGVWIQRSGTISGFYADTRCWNFARSAAQVAADYAAPLTGSEGGLVAYWPGDGSGNATPNVVSPGNANMRKIGGLDFSWYFPSQAIRGVWGIEYAQRAVSGSQKLQEAAWAQALAQQSVSGKSSASHAVYAQSQTDRGVAATGRVRPSQE